MTQAGYGEPEAKQHDPPLLFDLEVDPSERFNVAEQNSEATSAIRELVAKHRQELVAPPSQLELR
jgi:hypothetical protein